MRNCLSKCTLEVGNLKGNEVIPQGKNKPRDLCLHIDTYPCMSNNYKDRLSPHAHAQGGCESKIDLVELVCVLRTRILAQNHLSLHGTFLISF